MTAPGTGLEPALVLEDVSVGWGGTALLHDLAIHVPRGCVYALLGRNGCGKTTLVRSLLGQKRALRGRLRLLGEDAWEGRERLMARVGVVPEQPDAPPDMTVRQIAAFTGGLYPRWDAGLVAARLDRFGVPLATPFGRLSKGQQGATMLALALGHEPELLIFDDPTLGLDIVARDALLTEVIGELADRGVTVFLTTHALEIVEGIADQVGILRDGRLVVDGRMEQLKAERQSSLADIFRQAVGAPKGAQG